jgi:hypothetical protein
MLWKVIKDILEVAGYDLETIERELIFNNSTEEYGHTARPPRAAWSGNANLLGGEQ